MSLKIVETYWSWYNASLSVTEIRCLIECDTLVDLPGINSITGYKLTIGTVAHVIDTNSLYMMKSGGAWSVQAAGTDVYTRSQIDTMMAAKQDLLTFDSTPTANSDNPVKSKGIKSYVDAETTARQDECGIIANAGAKNVSKASFTSATIYGVTFTANSDGTVTASSTGTQSQNATLQSTTFLLGAGTYTFNSTENPQRDVTYDSYVYDVDNSRTIARDNPDDAPGSTFTISINTNVRINLRINRTYTANNLVFAPMIRYAVITDPSYQPYSPTNRELYEMIQALQ